MQPPSPKLLRPDRSLGVLLMPTHIDDFVEQSHPVRVVWAFVERLDLGTFLSAVKSVEGQAGRPAIDPRVLLALWLYAVIDGVDSGRKLARLCADSLPYRWICGNLKVEYHTLNDFRAENGEKFKVLLVNTITGLISERLVNIDTIALDGVRVRASAGTGSFRRVATLKRLRQAVDDRITELGAAWERDGTDPSRPGPKRAKRVLKERGERLDRAAKVAEELETARKAELAVASGKRVKQLAASLARGTRASSTDPEARVMHMPDNGFRPAFNAQVAAEAQNGFIVGAFITDQGTDNAQIPPMLDLLDKAYGTRKVSNVLADSGFRNTRGFGPAEKRGVAVYTPVPMAKTQEDRFAHRKSDNLATKRWRDRMGSEDGARLYRQRGRLIELVFARFRNRGLYQFPVRGKTRCEAVLILYSLAHNLTVEAAVRERAA